MYKITLPYHNLAQKVSAESTDQALVFYDARAEVTAVVGNG